jgi:DNA repair protein RadA/Sms
VLYFEGERHHNHRIVRAAKNRFGAANEIGVFEMTGTGLVPVTNPSQMFLQERRKKRGRFVVRRAWKDAAAAGGDSGARVGTKYGSGTADDAGAWTRIAFVVDRDAREARRHATASATTCS